MRKLFYGAVICLICVLFVGCPPRIEQITLWTTDDQPERIIVQEAIAAEFLAASGIAVEIVSVSNNEIDERVGVAYAAGDLPDVIYAPLANVAHWGREGIADAVAVTDVVADLDEDTFAAGALSLVDINGEYAGVPVDGWAHLLIYRQDLFDAAELQPPTSYEAILAAIAALHDPPNLYGFVAATDASQLYMMQVLEHIALANGVDIVDADSNVSLNTPELIEVLEFYKQLADASPAGSLYWKQSRELYLGGRAAMIVWSPFILDELAGLRDNAPVTFTSDPTSIELAMRTNFVTTIAGPSNPSGSGYIDARYLVIPVGATTQAAKQYVKFLLGDSYTQILATAPEGKLPIRRGDERNPERFAEEWSELQVGVNRKTPLSSIYSPDVIDNIMGGLNTGSRWGLGTGNGALYARINETRGIAEITHRYIDGEVSVEQAAQLIQQDTERQQSLP